VMLMEDEAGMDEKIIAVPASHISPYYDRVKEHTDLAPMVTRQIEHFFEHYKDLEEGKWVKCHGWDDAARAKALIVEAIERAKG